MKIILILLIITANMYAQEHVNMWKPLVVNDKEKVWYDQSMTDSIKGNKMNVWILQIE